MVLGVLQQHVAIAFRDIELTREESNRACGLPEHTAEGQGVTTPFVDGLPHNTLRLIGEPLQPKDAGAEIVR